MFYLILFFSFFFFNDTATTEIYTLSLHDALPISRDAGPEQGADHHACENQRHERSEEHTSELQSQSNLVCRLLLEKKKKNHTPYNTTRTPEHTRSISCMSTVI